MVGTEPCGRSGDFPGHLYVCTCRMDSKKKDVIERYIQAVSFHGPTLVDLTNEEQGDGSDSVMGFALPHSKDVIAASYFRNRLQMSYPGGGTGGHGTNSAASWENCTSGQQVQPKTDSPNAVSSTTQFNHRLCRFIATKADLLFEMHGKAQLQQSVDCRGDANQEALKLYANPPPLETLMAVPVPLRRKELFKVLKVGSIVQGEVTSKRPFGIFVKLTMLEFSKTRDFTGLHVEALCRTADLGGSAVVRDYKDPADAFVVGDRVRGVISVLDAEEERVSLSFRISRLPPEYESLQLGVIDEAPDSDAKRPHYDEDKIYEDYLQTDVGFNNPRSVDTLIDELGIDEKAPCSLLRSFHRSKYPEGDFAEALRKRQSAKWSMETTAKGVEHFKAGNHDAADKYFEHALQIDSENVEALVARGALFANQGQLTVAVRDFRRALTINGTHRNAHKYLTATLMEQGIQLEKEGELEEALECFKEALDFDRGQTAAREHLEKVQRQIVERNQKKNDASRKEQKNKSKFGHVRQLIKAEQSRAKKKKMARKKKKQKSQRKKKKIKSKSHRRTRRSTSSEDFSYSDDTSSSSSAGDAQRPGSEWKSRRGSEGARKRSGTKERRTSGSGRKRGPLDHSDNEGPEGCGREAKIHRESGFLRTQRGEVDAMGQDSSLLRYSSAEKRMVRKRKTRSSSESSSSSTRSSGYLNKHGTNHARRSRKKRKRSRSSDSSSPRSLISSESSPDRRYSRSMDRKEYSQKTRRKCRSRSRSYSYSSSDSADQKSSGHKSREPRDKREEKMRS